MESAGCSPKTKGIMDIFELLVILAVIAMAPLLMKSMDWLDRYRDLKYRRLSEKLGKASDQIALQNGFGKLLAEPLSLSLVVKPDYPFFIYQNGIVLWPNRQQACIYHWHQVLNYREFTQYTEDFEPPYDVKYDRSGGHIRMSYQYFLQLTFLDNKTFELESQAPNLHTQPYEDYRKGILIQRYANPVPDVLNTINQQLNKEVKQRDLATIARRERLTLGVVLVDLEGLIFENQRIAWHDIKAIEQTRLLQKIKSSTRKIYIDMMVIRFNKGFLFEGESTLMIPLKNIKNPDSILAQYRLSKSTKFEVC